MGVSNQVICLSDLLIRQVVLINDLGHCEVLLHHLDLDSEFVAGHRPGDDNNVAAFHFRDPVSLIASRLDRDRSLFSLLYWWTLQRCCL